MSTDDSATWIVEINYDPSGHYGGRRGCWRARLKDHPTIHDAGRTPQEAYDNCVTTAKSHGYRCAPAPEGQVS